jgi:hypothetical protein
MLACRLMNASAGLNYARMKSRVYCLWNSDSEHSEILLVPSEETPVR